ncbi:MAG: C40 family peptidase [Bacteroidales bacterium]|nr:C40 family peptidase [Bacteroidales bacterium]
MKGIVLTTQVPMRSEPDHKSEMISQILFGETYTIIEKIDNWLLVKTTFDSYTGWISRSSFLEIATDTSETALVTKELLVLGDEQNDIITVSAGSEIMTPTNGKFNLNNKAFNILFSLDKYGDNNNSPKQLVTETAQKFLGAPYLWGGRTCMGFDCSGFVQIVFKINGIALPRDASAQVNTGQTINIVEEAHQGDLAFFGDETNISHVGIILNNNKIIHCSGKVKIESLDNTGIFNGEKYTHFLRTVKRI